MIIADYHTHTYFSSDSNTEPEAQIQSTLKKGLSYLCFTDHEDMDYCYPDEFQLDLPSYTASMEKLRNRYQNQIQLGIGIEIGLQPHLSQKLSDFVDYIIRYRPDKTQPYHYLDYSDILDEILKTLIQKGKGIECNTAGFKYGLNQPNPERDLLTRYKELGGEILTIGSDAHKPMHIAYDFEKLPALLNECGFQYYTIFHNRSPKFLPI